MTNSILPRSGGSPQADSTNQPNLKRVYIASLHISGSRPATLAVFDTEAPARETLQKNATFEYPLNDLQFDWRESVELGYNVATLRIISDDLKHRPVIGYVECVVFVAAAPDDVTGGGGSHE